MLILSELLFFVFVCWLLVFDSGLSPCSDSSLLLLVVTFALLLRPCMLFVRLKVSEFLFVVLLVLVLGLSLLLSLL